MECFYTEEVFEQIDEEIEFFEDMLKPQIGQTATNLFQGKTREDFSYALSILKHMRIKMTKLEVKDFQYGE